MAKIHTLSVENFRSLERFEQVFSTSDFICIIGRGDSGKSTILDAISIVLSPNWNIQFFDTDFFELDVSRTLVIESTIYDLPKTLLRDNKFGLYIRGLNKATNQIADQLEEAHEPCLTIRLSVGKDLEPKWTVVNQRQQDNPCEIRASDRALLNTFLISDYVDRHFSWNKGNPLYSLLKNEDAANEKSNVVLDAFRQARSSIDPKSFLHLKGVIKKVELAAKKIGLSLDDITSNIDHKDISVRDGKISLHHDAIPLRAKGKGSKRLLSIAIQIELLASGGILLIDEIEQGLEPDRVRHLVNVLKQQNHGQVFVTTHSRDVVVELECNSLFLMRRDSKMTTFTEVFQGCIRKSPEAFFSKRIMVCEGATEVGICRAINFNEAKKNNKSFSSLGTAIVDGGGSNFIDYCVNFKDAGFEVAALCDSDDLSINAQKKSLASKGITVFDWDPGLALESQIFLDLPWTSVQKLIEYAYDQKGEQSITDLIKNKIPGNELGSDWYRSENNELRIAIGSAASGKKMKDGKVVEDKGWFKRIDHGEFLGETILESLSAIKEKKLGQQVRETINWLSNE